MSKLNTLIFIFQFNFFIEPMTFDLLTIDLLTIHLSLN